MIFNKIAAILLIITLNIELATSTILSDTLGGQIYLMNLLHERQERASKSKKVFQSTNNTVNDAEVQGENTESPSDIQGLNSSGKPVPLVRKRVHASEPRKGVLQDTTSIVKEVQPVRGNVEEAVQMLKQPVPPVNKQFKILIERGEYEKIVELGENMNDEEFLKQLCQVIETPDQYNGIVSYLKRRKMVASFCVFGDIGVVKGAIIESKVYEKERYVNDGDLETALPLALENDSHDRVIELLDVRKGITAEKDEQPKVEGTTTSFGLFVHDFLDNLAPWKDETALRRFLILRGEELRTKYRDIFDTLCRWLVYKLTSWLHLPNAGNLLADLIGQPLLLTPVTFAREFLYHDDVWRRSAFIKHGWRETIEEGLKEEYVHGGKKLWQVMQKEKPDQFPGEFPSTEGTRIAVCMHIPTKQQKEDEWIKNNEEWIKKHALILYNKLKPHDDIFNLLPNVIWTIVSEYALYIS